MGRRQASDLCSSRGSMSRALRLDAEAEAEINDAIDHYDREREGLGTAFWAELSDALVPWIRDSFHKSGHSPCTCCVRSAKRCIFARISSAVLVHLNGLRFSLWAST